LEAFAETVRRDGTREILLVTGSRALCDTAEAHRWALRYLVSVVYNAHDGAEVWSGGAPGPDTWALDFADDMDLVRRVYWATGEIATHAPGSGRHSTDGGVIGRWSDSRRPRPLDRNRAMVADLATYRDSHSISVIALTAPWSHTRGTQHTIGLARNVLRDFAPVYDYDCPRELGPA
jgi:hypothetical protein